MYVFQADTYCDSCGLQLIEELTAQGITPAVDSDEWPQSALEEETDGPDHCASYDQCLEAVNLADYGLPKDAPMFGAESPLIGAPLSAGLTEDGVSYLREMLNEEPRTPYQSALHNYWSEEYALELS